MQEQQPVVDHAASGTANRREHRAAAVIERLASYVRTAGRHFSRDEMNAR